MKKVFAVSLFLLFVVYGCAGSSGVTKTERNLGNVLKFSLDVVSLGLLLTGNGNPAHIPAASVDTVLDFGKAFDSAVEEAKTLEKERK